MHSIGEQTCSLAYRCTCIVHSCLSARAQSGSAVKSGTGIAGKYGHGAITMVDCALDKEQVEVTMNALVDDNRPTRQALLLHPTVLVPTGS